MNTQMFAHEAVRHNLDTLARRGVRFVEPGEGYLACGWIGRGRLAEPEEIVAAAEAILRPSTVLRGQRVLVTAGPTYEDLDPVRYLGNRSSGRMGVALAGEAFRRGADVTIIAGPTSVDMPAGCEVVRVRSAIEMHAAVMSRADSAQVVIMAAAVADYTPVDRARHKVAKGDSGDTDMETLTLVLKRTPDILAELGRRRLASGKGPVLVGFAAETEHVLEHAAAKRERKQVDLIVANDVSRTDAGFDAETNAVTIIGPDGAIELPLQAKSLVAAAILDRVEALLSTSATGV
jgi:phosphopantothenoylcysteine decarboxylase/phosphopantothenate--cysteine ligase